MSSRCMGCYVHEELLIHLGKDQPKYGIYRDGCLELSSPLSEAQNSCALLSSWTPGQGRQINSIPIPEISWLKPEVVRVSPCVVIQFLCVSMTNNVDIFGYLLSMCTTPVQASAHRDSEPWCQVQLGRWVPLGNKTNAYHKTKHSPPPELYS